MGDIPGFLASDFPDDARRVPGQEAFTARQQADHEAGDKAERDEKQIFYKQDEAGAEDTASDDEVAGQSPDESTYGDPTL